MINTLSTGNVLSDLLGGSMQRRRGSEEGGRGRSGGKEEMIDLE